ncbi:MAG: TrkH family potassium uptake protein [Fidelibacterota bacterium]
MLHVRSILNVLAALITLLGLTMLGAAAWSWYYGDADLDGIFMASGLTVAVGLPIWFFTRGRVQLSIKDGFAVVTLTWLSIALFGAFLFLFTDAIPNMTDAFFESMSGVTTTGASIINMSYGVEGGPQGIESLSHGVLFWRSFIQWIGGMGIIVFSIAILPLLGVGGVQLFKAEVPGPVPDKIKPRVRETAKILWLVYFGISLAEMLLLYAGGMTIFDAMCHMFTTMATGGFSTKNASIGGFNSIYIEYVIIFFMFLAGVNFSLHWKGLRGDFKSYFRDGEFKFYLGLIFFFTVLLIISNLVRSNEGVLSHTMVRAALFQVVSILTTTGYGTADYELWGWFAQFLLLLMMFIGGSAGSTGGGMKIMRIMTITKYSLSEAKRLLHPRAVIPVRVGRRLISDDVIRNTLSFFLFFVAAFVLTSISLTALGIDLVTAIGATAASIGNIGPGLGEVGPLDHYGHLPGLAKWLLSFCMLLGRLEVFTVIVLFSRAFWKR